MINANISKLPVINRFDKKKYDAAQVELEAAIKAGYRYDAERKFNIEKFGLLITAVSVVLLSYAQKDKVNARAINDLDSLLANQAGNGIFIAKLTGNAKAVFDELAPLTAEEMLGRANALLENLDWAADLVAAKAQRDADIKAVNANNAAEAEFLGLPALTGSEKQIAWANTLRAEALKVANADQRVSIEKGKWKVAATKAKFWIDNRLEDKAATLTEALKK